MADGAHGKTRGSAWRRTRWIWIGLLVAVAVGGILSIFASPYPDGLEKVAEDKGFAGAAVERPLLHSPLPDYLFPGIQNERLATGLAGFLGTLLLFGAGYGLGRLLAGNRRSG
jgi:cobalt/nickel transport protein